jgi:hypothetical protein
VAETLKTIIVKLEHQSGIKTKRICRQWHWVCQLHRLCILQAEWNTSWNYNSLHAWAKRSGRTRYQNTSWTGQMYAPLSGNGFMILGRGNPLCHLHSQPLPYLCYPGQSPYACVDWLQTWCLSPSCLCICQYL